MRTIAVANRHPRLRFNRRASEQILRQLDAHHTQLAPRRSQLDPDGEISLVFLTDPALAQLHADFLDDPSTTDVITFEGQPELGTAGEICVSADTAARFARDHRRDFSEELTLYIVHGWLHLAGYDDLVPAKKRVMRRAEARAMKILAASGSIPKFTLQAPRQAAGRARKLVSRTVVR